MKKDSWTLFACLSHFTFLTFASKLSALSLLHVYQSSIHCWWNERRFSRWLDVVWWRRGAWVGAGGSKLTSPAECLSEWGQVLQLVVVAIGVAICRSSFPWERSLKNEGTRVWKLPSILPPNYYPYLRLLPIITKNSLIPSHSLL